MEIQPIAELTGLAIVAAAAVRATAVAATVAVRRTRTARQEREFVAQFEQFASEAARRADAARETGGLAWNGKRKFRIAARRFENPKRDICSFYLVPCDGRQVPTFRPGQFLTFELPVPDQPRPVVRCYSLSSSPTERRYYRVSIKKLGAPAGVSSGLASCHFHDRLTEGAVVDARAPGGDFCLDEDSIRPVILLAGGVGITPIVSMLDWLVATGSRRKIWLFYGVRNRVEHAMYDYLETVCRHRPNIHKLVAYSRPTRDCRPGRDYQVKGHLTAELLAPLIQAQPCDIYMCGPERMMDSLNRGLAAMGVPETDIRRERFGAASQGNAVARAAPVADIVGESFRVQFARSGKTLQWTAAEGSLLDLAETNGVKARFGCRQGICGTCAAAIRQGSVDYVQAPDRELAAGRCLPCIARPQSDLVIDL